MEDAVALIKTFIGTRYDERVVTALVDACESGQITPGRVRLSRRAKELGSSLTLKPSTPAPAVAEREKTLVS